MIGLVPGLSLTWRLLYKLSISASLKPIYSQTKPRHRYFGIPIFLIMCSMHYIVT